MYLYFPTGGNLKSDALNISAEVTKEIAAVPIASAEVMVDSVVHERMKLTALLLRYQKKLSEAQSKKNEEDSVARVEALKAKIVNLEKEIQELSK